jgi:hypothetical protein
MTFTALLLTYPNIACKFHGTFAFCGIYSDMYANER